MSHPPDDLDDLLAPRPTDPRADHLAAILRQTGRVVTLRRWVRRAKFGVAAAVLLAGGTLGGWVAKPTPTPVREFVAVPVPFVLAPAEPPEVIPSGEAITAEQYELKAEQASAAEAARLYKLAGEWFEKSYDFAQARRCYRLHLLAAPTERAVSTDDSWLLISLKTSQLETDRDPKQGS
jgi:hypothetical protein